MSIKALILCGIAALAVSIVGVFTTKHRAPVPQAAKAAPATAAQACSTFVMHYLPNAKLRDPHTTRHGDFANVGFSGAAETPFGAKHFFSCRLAHLDGGWMLVKLDYD
jgi:hypothetical protein